MATYRLCRAYSIINLTRVSFGNLNVFKRRARVLFNSVLACLFALYEVDGDGADALRTYSARAATVSTVNLARSVVSNCRLFATALVILSATLTTLRTRLARGNRITYLPYNSSLTRTLVLTVRVFNATNGTEERLLANRIMDFLKCVTGRNLIRHTRERANVNRRVPYDNFTLNRAGVMITVGRTTNRATRSSNGIRLERTKVPTGSAVLLAINVRRR